MGIPYVQDLLEEQAGEVARLLLSETSCGQLYVCGDGQHMAADVHNALKHVAMQELGSFGLGLGMGLGLTLLGLALGSTLTLTLTLTLTRSCARCSRRAPSSYTPPSPAEATRP